MLGLFDDTALTICGWLLGLNLNLVYFGILALKCLKNTQVAQSFWVFFAAKRQIKKGKKHHLIKSWGKILLERIKITKLTTETQ